MNYNPNLSSNPSPSSKPNPTSKNIQDSLSDILNSHANFSGTTNHENRIYFRIKKKINKRCLLILPIAVLLLPCLFSCALIEAVPSIFTGLDYAVSRKHLEKEGIDDRDIRDIDNGDLMALKKRYESRDADTLTLYQHRLLCDLYTIYHEVDSAFNCLDQLEKREVSHEFDTNVIMGKRALIYLQSGEYEKAVKIARSLNNPGGRYVYALAMALTWKKSEAEEIAIYFEKYGTLKYNYFAANIFLAIGEYSRALEIALDPTIRLAMDYGLGKKTVFRADIFDEFKFGFFDFFSFAPKSNVYVEFIVAKCLLETGHIEEAKGHLDLIINYERISPYRDIYWMALFDRGRVAEMESNYEDAINFYQRAIKIIEAIRSSIKTDIGRIGFIADKQGVYENLISILIKKGDNRLAFEYIERSRGRTLVDLLSSKVEFSITPLDSPDTLEILKKFTDAQKELRKDYQMENARHFNKLRSAEDQLKKAQDTLHHYSPRISNLVAVRPLSFEELQSIAHDDELFVGYYFTKVDGWYVYVLNKHKGPFFSKLRDGNLERAVMDFRRELENDPQKTLSLTHFTKAHDLYEWLIEPVEIICNKEKFQKAKTITILPSGPLYYLPFGALYSGKYWLLERYVLKVLPSLSIAELIWTRDRQSESTLILANPTGDLWYTEIEAIKIREIFPDSLVLLQSDATDERFLMLSRYYDYVHIGSHAKLNINNPLDSKILLAKTEKTPGEITVDDLYRKVKFDSSLVVLSACETALSQIAKGDELLGLTTGVLYAGSKGYIGSLWNIEDKATAFLMENFYRGLKNINQPADALRDAQLLTYTQEEYRHPFFWAAFQFVGR